MRRRLAIALLGLTLALPVSGFASPQDDLYASWERTLVNYVDGEGLVDYAGLKARGMADLEEFHGGAGAHEPR